MPDVSAKAKKLTNVAVTEPLNGFAAQYLGGPFLDPRKGVAQDA